MVEKPWETMAAAKWTHERLACRVLVVEVKTGSRLPYGRHLQVESLAFPCESPLFISWIVQGQL